VLAATGGWAILLRYGTLECAIAAPRASPPRLRRTLPAAAAFVRDQLGLSRFDVDLGGFELANTPRRTDPPERLRTPHDAAAHDAWFREQVTSAIEEADDPNAEWVPHDVVKTDWERERAELLKQIEREQRS